jgi:hypothetical protein
MRNGRLATVASVIAAICWFTPLAHAQATRTWVSGVGDDVNPCSRTAPCKTFAGAISKTAVKGEIDNLDPGGFGAVTIVKSIALDGISGVAGVLAAGSNGINVVAGATDVVILRNLDINGAGTGLIGIRIVSAGEVRIENCLIYGFTGRGVSDERTSGRLVVTDTIVSNNGQTGIVAVPPSTSTLTLSLQHVRSDGNGNSGFALTEGAKATITHSTASGNVNFGFYADGVGGSSAMNLDNCTSFGNGVGVTAQSAGTVRLSNTTVTGNGSGLTTSSGGGIFSYGTNHIDGNGAGNGPPTGGLAQQ